ncbi:MAG TPA: hypothetical protein VH989_00855 [Actinomycetota bacterium]|jgi:hypothetical protein
MNKRSAVIVAAGLVVALVAGGIALERGVLGPPATAAEASVDAGTRPKPIIRTTERTVKIHRKAKAGNASGSPTVSSSSTSTGSWSDDEGEFEHEAEHESEGEFEDD